MDANMTENPFTVEKVGCCVCDETGRIKGWLLSRSCSVCDGTGQRDILMLKSAPPYMQDELRTSARLGYMGYPTHLGYGFNSSLGGLLGSIGL